MADEKEKAGEGGLYARVPIRALVDPNVTDGDFRVLAAIAGYMRRNNVAWPSQDLLAVAANMERPSVTRCIRRLEALGHLTVQRFRSKNGHKQAIYKVHMPATHLPRKPRTTPA
jgi:hypothetical protein